MKNRTINLRVVAEIAQALGDLEERGAPNSLCGSW